VHFFWLLAAGFWLLQEHLRMTTRHRLRGFTLIESLIATVVLAVAVVGIAGTLASTYQQQKDQVSAAEATQLARQMMEEISGKPFAPPAGSNVAGWSSGNRNREQYDEIADYNGLADVSTSIKTLGGDSQSVGSMGPYNRSVRVVTGPVPVGHTAPAEDFKTVTITVTRPKASAIVITKVFMRATLSS
jgi:prepilin-type N-terminal cleavage/methylation domain-containing protein